MARTNQPTGLVAQAKLDAAEEDGTRRDRATAGILAFLDGVQLATGAPTGIVAHLMRAWYTGGRSARQVERFAQAWQGLELRISGLEAEARLSREVLESEDFVEFVDVALTRAVAEQDDTKRMRYAAIAGGYAATTINLSDGPRMLLFLDAVTEREIAALGRLITCTRDVFSEIAMVAYDQRSESQMTEIKRAYDRFDLDSSARAILTPWFRLSELGQDVTLQTVEDLETLRRLGLVRTREGQDVDMQLSLTRAGVGFVEWLGLDSGASSSETAVVWDHVWSALTVRQVLEDAGEHIRTAGERLREWRQSLDVAQPRGNTEEGLP